MGDSLNQLWSGVQNIGGDFMKAAGGNPGGALSDLGSQVGSIPGLIGKDLGFSAPTVAGANQGVSADQGNYAADKFGSPAPSVLSQITGNTPGLTSGAAPLGGGDPTTLNLPSATPDASLAASINPGGVSATPQSSILPTGAITPTPSNADAMTALAAPSAAAPGPQLTPASQLTPGQIQPGGMQGFINSLLNPKALPVALEGGMLLRDVLQGQPSQEKTLKALATEQQNQATLQQNLGNTAQQGSLPQALSQQLEQQLNQRIAAIKSQYAAAGMFGSSAEAADIQAAQIDHQGQKFALGQQLASQSLSAAQSDFGSAANYLQQIMNFDTAQGTELGNDLAAFAGMLAGTGRPGTGGISINLPAGSTVH